jgi:hypothetical protein
MKKCIYIKVSENRITIRCIKRNQSTERFGDFSTSRLAVGDFDLALQLIKSGLKELDVNPYYIFPPMIIMHQTHLGQSKLSSVELRVLYELGTLAGGNPVHIWQGDALADEDIYNKKYI